MGILFPMYFMLSSFDDTDSISVFLFLPNFSILFSHLAPDSLPFRKHPPDDREEYDTKSCEYSERYKWRDIRDSMHRVAESIDHIEDRVRMRDRLPDRWEHRDRVEHTPEIRERCEDKVGNDGCRVKAIGYESVQESDQSEEE